MTRDDARTADGRHAEKINRARAMVAAWDKQDTYNGGK